MRRLTRRQVAEQKPRPDGARERQHGRARRESYIHAKKRQCYTGSVPEDDADNASYYDQMAGNEGALEKELILMQKPGHDNTNHGIAVKHGAELIRIQDEIEKTAELIGFYSNEIEALRSIYNSHNGI